MSFKSNAVYPIKKRELVLKKEDGNIYFYLEND